MVTGVEREADWGGDGGTRKQTGMVTGADREADRDGDGDGEGSRQADVRH